MKNEEKKIPEKMEAVCQAVLRLKASGQDISVMKVSDIAKEAGIGKGTVYDYFETKEDIFIKALSYEYCMEISRLEKSVFSGKTFREKIYRAFDWIERSMKSRSMVMQLMQKNPEVLEKGRDFCERLGVDISGEDMTARLCENIFRQGKSEGLIRMPENKLEQDMIIRGVVFGLGVYLFHQGKYENTVEEAKELCYQNLLKLLS